MTNKISFSLKTVRMTTPQSYLALVKQFTPLDLILFKGSDYVSDAICIVEQKILGDGEFSHCGILVNSDLLPTVPQLIPGRWYIWESTMSATSGILSDFTDGQPNVETGKGKFGVQIRDLEQVVTAYTKNGGKVAWAKLLNNPWGGVGRLVSHNNLVKTVCDVNKIYGTRTYDVNCLDLFGTVFPCMRKPRDLFDSMLYDGHLVLTSFHLEANTPNDPGITGWQFCSELVARVYEAIGLISPNLDPRDFAPVDFLGVSPKLTACLVVTPVYITPSLNTEMYVYNKKPRRK